MQLIHWHFIYSQYKRLECKSFHLFTKKSNGSSITENP